VDQELARQGDMALAEGKARTVRIDTTGEEDADLGYGTFCGGVMELLIEPLTGERKRVFRELRRRLEAGARSWLVHDLDTGRSSVAGEAPESNDRLFVQPVPPLTPLYIFGATPLARRLVAALDDMDYRIHVLDWREDYLDGFAGLDGVSTHLDVMPFGGDAWVLIVSHDYNRDKAVLEAALARGCPCVGMLSSRPRRNRMFEELRGAGVAEADLDRVASPVGLDIGGRSDPEIAVAIAAQLVQWRHR
jgi:xanthine dehydrogenase accessory factor